MGRPIKGYLLKSCLPIPIPPRLVTGPTPSLPNLTPPLPDGSGSPPLGFGIPRRSTSRRVRATSGGLDPRLSFSVEFSHHLLTPGCLWRLSRDQWRSDSSKGGKVEMLTGSGTVGKCRRASSAETVARAIRGRGVNLIRKRVSRSLGRRHRKAMKPFRKMAGDSVRCKLKSIEISKILASYLEIVNIEISKAESVWAVNEMKEMSVR